MENKNEIKNLNENEIRNLNDNEVNEVSGGASIIEKLKYRRIPSGLIDNVGPIFREEKCRVCGKSITVRYARPPMVGCPDSICDDCAKKKNEKRKEKQKHSNNVIF